MTQLLVPINNIISKKEYVELLQININEIIYLQPFNLQWKDSSSFIDPTLQFIFSFFIKLGLIDKKGKYTEIISKMLTEPIISNKSNIKFDFHKNYMTGFSQGWIYGQGGNMVNLYGFIIDKLVNENKYIENKITTTIKTYSGHPQNCDNDSELSQTFISATHKKVYKDVFEGIFICHPNIVYKSKIILPKFLIVEIFLVQKGTQINEYMNFGKFTSISTPHLGSV